MLIKLNSKFDFSFISKSVKFAGQVLGHGGGELAKPNVVI